jgi:hypothetical protein
MIALLLSSPVLAEMTEEEFLIMIEEQTIITKNALVERSGISEVSATCLGLYSSIHWVVLIHERFQRESPFCNNIYDGPRASAANREVTRDMFAHAERYVIPVKRLVKDYLEWEPKDFEKVDKRMRAIVEEAHCSSM